MKVAYRQIFANRNFTALWVGETVSILGDTFNLTSLWFLIMSMSKGSGTSSAAPLMTMLMVTTATYIFISPFAGVFADRWDRKKTMIAMDLIRAFLMLLIPLANSLLQIYLISFLMTVARIFFRPCIRASMQKILKKEEFLLANSVMSIGKGMADATGYFAGGVLIAIFGYNFAFYIDAASYLISAIMIISMTLPHIPAAKGEPLRERVATVFRNMREGFIYVLQNRIARDMFITNSILLLGGGAYNMMQAVFVGETPGAGTKGFGLVTETMTLSFLAGSLLFGGFANRLNQFSPMAGGYSGWGLECLALGVLLTWPSRSGWQSTLG